MHAYILVRTLTSILSRKLEVCNPLLTERHIPPNFNILLCLTLLQCLVIVCLQLHQRPKYMLVLEGIIIPGERGRGKRGEERREREEESERRKKRIKRERERERDGQVNMRDGR